jgi:uncharacterized protein YaiL (DUF2058 family)
MARKYIGKSQMDMGVGGGGSGGMGGGSKPSGRMGNAKKAAVRAKVDAKDAAAEARRQRRLEKLTEKRHAKNSELEEANTPEGIAYRKQLYDMGITTSDFDLGFKKGGKVKCMARGGGCEVRGKTKGRMV